MNKITRKALDQTKKQHPRHARQNSAEFAEHVALQYWEIVKDENYTRLFYKALRRWKGIHPEHFEDGFPKHNDPAVIGTLKQLEIICESVLYRSLAYKPELKLESWEKDDIFPQPPHKQLNLFEDA